MAGERTGGGVLLALIACLTAAILLLGVELALAVRDADRLPLAGSLALLGAGCGLYAATAWRSAQGGGAKLFLAWWGTMLLGHTGLGLLLGVFRAALADAPLDATGVMQWVAGASLPIGVLQVGYAIGISSVAYGNGATEAAEPAPAPAAVQAPAPPEPAPVVQVPASPPAPHLEVYAAAIDKLRARDCASLVRFAAQAAKCEGGLVVTREGQVVAAVEMRGLDATRLAEVLPKLMGDLEQLADPRRPASTLLRAAFGGQELLAASGTRLIGCLVGPQPGSGEIAEVVLPVLVSRAEGLQGHSTDAGAAKDEGAA